MDHDVALLELAFPAPMSYTIQSVCLPSPVHYFLKTAECYIAGWGSMREGGERFKMPLTSGITFQRALLLLHNDKNRRDEAQKTDKSWLKVEMESYTALPACLFSWVIMQNVNNFCSISVPCKWNLHVSTVCENGHQLSFLYEDIVATLGGVCPFLQHSVAAECWIETRQRWLQKDQCRFSRTVLTCNCSIAQNRDTTKIINFKLSAQSLIDLNCSCR